MAAPAVARRQFLNMVSTEEAARVPATHSQREREGGRGGGRERELDRETEIGRYKEQREGDRFARGARVESVCVRGGLLLREEGECVRVCVRVYKFLDRIFMNSRVACGWFQRVVWKNND